MTVATRQMPTTQWRLLNGITANPGGNARDLGNAANIGLDDLIAMEEAKLVYLATPGGRQVPLDSVAVGRLGTVNLHLTTAGRQWVEGNPGNKVLQYLRACAKARVLLVTVAKKADVGGDVLLVLNDRGLMEAVDWNGVIRLTADMAHCREPDFEIQVRLTRFGRSVARGAV